MSAGTLIQFPLAAGVDEAADPKQRPPGALTRLENGVWRKSSRLDKRYGTRGHAKSVRGGGTLSSASRLIVHDDRLGLVSAGHLYAHAPAMDDFVRVAGTPSVMPTWSTVVDQVYGAASWDGVVVGTHEVVAWSTGATTYNADVSSLYFLIRSTGGETEAVATPVATGAKSVRLLADVANTRAFLIWEEVATSSLKVTTINVANGSFTTATFTLGYTYDGLFDACFVAGRVVLAFATPTNLRVSSYVPGTWGTSVATVATSDAGLLEYAGIGIDGDTSDHIYLAYSYAITGSGVIKATKLHPTTLAVVSGPAQTTAYAVGTVGVRWLSVGNAMVVYGVRLSATILTPSSSSVVYSGGSSFNAGTWQTTHHLRWLSRPFVADGRIYALASARAERTLDGYPSSVVLELNAATTELSFMHRHVGTVDILISGQMLGGPLPGGFAIGDSGVVLSPYQSSPSKRTSEARQGLRRVELVPEAKADDYARSAQLGPTTFVASGIVSTWDGKRIVPLGFATQPEILNTTAFTSGGAMAAGVYLYSAVVEYRDSAGVLHRSAPAEPVSVTVAGGGAASVALSIATASLDHHEVSNTEALTPEFRSVTIAIYRSTVGGSVLYRLTREPSVSVVRNDPFTANVAFLDVYSDASVGANESLGSRPPIYTIGGTLEDRQPPSMLTILAHKGRLWGIDGGRQTVWFTKPLSEDPTVVPAFAAPFRIAFDRDLTALASLDDKLVVFAAGQIWFLPGDGPASNGQGSDYPEPIAVQSDVGCVNPRSVVSTNDGVMFQSDRGLFLLSRQLEVVWVGRPVQDTLEAFPRITSAALVTRQSHVRFTATTEGGEEGVVFVFDYLSRQWSVFRYGDSDADVDSSPVADSVMCRGAWLFVTPGGKLYAEDESTFLDDGTRWVSCTWETAWIEAAGPLGFERVRKAQLLGDRYTDCDVTLSFAFDHRPTFAQSWTWKSDKLSEIGDGVNVGMRVGSQNGANPRCRAFRIRFSDASPSGEGAVVGSGQGVNISAVGLEIIPKPGMDRRSAKARA